MVVHEEGIDIRVYFVDDVLIEEVEVCELFQVEESVLVVVCEMGHFFVGDFFEQFS